MLSKISSRPALELFLISSLILFVELSLIRFLPGNIRVLSYFTNLVLLASFWGIGLGALLAKSRRDLSVLYPWALLSLLVVIVYFRGVEVLPARFLESGEFLWLQYRNLTADAARWSLVPVLIIFFVMVSAVFVPLGQMLGRALQRLQAIQAYSIDIAGSLTGTVLFALFSMLAASPMVWFVLVAVVSLLLAASWKRLLLVALAFVPILLICSQVSRTSRWSPYYKVDTVASSEQVLDVYVNESFHQSMVDFRESATDSSTSIAELLHRFQAPYQLFPSPPQRVLILGAGTGNDVVAALESGAGRVDAVEIDPVIADIGRRRNPMKPYDDPRVTLYVTDARNFLATTEERYDLVIFGTLDSQTRLAGLSGLRLDNYVYTVECLQAVRRLLRDDGLVALNFSVARPWIRTKIAQMIRNVFGNQYQMRQWSEGWLFDTTFLAGPRLVQAGLATPARVVDAVIDPQTPTDDWPFLYLKSRQLPAFTLQAIAVLLVLTAILPYLLLRRRFWAEFGGSPQTAGYAPFFLLGVAFLLLETRGITEIALLYGSTWVVNTVVFTSIFLVILLANLTAQLADRTLIKLSICGLVCSLLLSYLVPVRTLLGDLPVLRTAGAILFVGAPLYFAGTFFISLFRTTPNRDYAFGVNLIGAMVGGLVEFASVYLGFKALSLLALGLYCLAFLSWIRRPAQA